MSRELQSDIVSSVDRSGSGIAEEQSNSQLQHGNPSSASVAMMSDAVSTAAETSLIDDDVIDEPGSVSNDCSSLRHEPDSTSGVSRVCRNIRLI